MVLVLQIDKLVVEISEGSWPPELIGVGCLLIGLEFELFLQGLPFVDHPFTPGFNLCGPIFLGLYLFVGLQRIFIVVLFL